jgi:hypothetical protein
MSMEGVPFCSGFELTLKTYSKRAALLYRVGLPEVLALHISDKRSITVSSGYHIASVDYGLGLLESS